MDVKELPDVNMPEIYTQLVELIGEDNTLKVLNTFGGQIVYIPKSDAIIRAERNKNIRAAFTGYNYTELCRTFHLTEKQIRIICGDIVTEVRAAPMEGQTTLFDDIT